MKDVCAMAIDTILLVDDDPQIVEVYGQLLMANGYSVTKATSGNAALASLRSNMVDLVISDIKMPDGDGFFLLDSIVAEFKPMPFFFFLTGFSTLSFAELENRGCHCLFKKPLSLGELLEAIENLEVQK